jgi:hypothetical protein
MSATASADAQASRSGVVLALHGEEEPRGCLERAHRFARTLEQRLVVVRVLPAESKVRSVVQRLLGPRPAKARPRDAYKATRRWLLRCLGAPAKAIRVVVMGGEFVQMAAACVRHTRAHMIVVSPELQRAGHQAIALARASGAQVLIARGEDGNSPILAATDLQDPAFPVLRSAAEVAQAQAADDRLSQRGSPFSHVRAYRHVYGRDADRRRAQSNAARIVGECVPLTTN